MDKKLFKMPEAELVRFDCEDVISTSGGSGFDPACPECIKPGWGWGDKNHEHFGPPGQRKKSPTCTH